MATAVSSSATEFAAVFGSIARFFGTASDVPVAVRRHLGEYTRMSADQVLASEDRDHLLALIDALSGDNAFWDDVSTAARRAIEMKVVTPQDGVGKLDMKSLDAILGSTAAALCEKGHTALSVLVIGLTNFTSTAGYEKAEANKREEQTSLSSLSDMLYESETPLVLRKVIAALLRSLTSMLVIARAEELGKRLPAWLAFALAEVFAGPYEDASEAITKPNLVQDIVRAADDDERAQENLIAAFGYWRERAASTGETVYFPVDYETR